MAWRAERGVAARCPPPSAAPARPGPAMPPARADYLAPWWAAWLHGLPHRGLRLQPVPAAFHPRDPEYQQVRTPLFVPPPPLGSGPPIPSRSRRSFCSGVLGGALRAGGVRAPTQTPAPRSDRFHPARCRHKARFFPGRARSGPAVNPGASGTPGTPGSRYRRTAAAADLGAGQRSASPPGGALRGPRVEHPKRCPRTAMPSQLRTHPPPRGRGRGRAPLPLSPL